MVKFNLSQMTACIIYDDTKLSEALKGQIATAPSKANTLHLSCDINTLVKARDELNEYLNANSAVNRKFYVMALQELDEIIQKHN